jgi:uncharacterized membrane protein
MSSRDLYGERGDWFDAFLDRLLHFIRLAVVISIAVILSLYMASVIFIHEIDSYTVNNIMEKK